MVDQARRPGDRVIDRRREVSSNRRRHSGLIDWIDQKAGGACEEMRVQMRVRLNPVTTGRRRPRRGDVVGRGDEDGRQTLPLPPLAASGNSHLLETDARQFLATKGELSSV